MFRECMSHTHENVIFTLMTNHYYALIKSFNLPRMVNTKRQTTYFELKMKHCNQRYRKNKTNKRLVVSRTNYTLANRSCDHNLIYS